MSSCGIFVHSIGISFDDCEQILQPRHERLRRLALKRRTCSLFLPTILPCALLREVIYNVAQLDIAIYICDQLLFHAAQATAAAAASSGGGSSMMMSSSSKAAASRARSFARWVTCCLRVCDTYRGISIFCCDFPV